MLYTGSYELRFLSSSSVPCEAVTFISISIFSLSQPFLAYRQFFFGDFLTFLISGNQRPLNKTFKAPLKKLFHAAGTWLGRRHTTDKNSLPRFDCAQWLCDVTNSWRPNPYSTCVCIHSLVRFVGFLLPNVKEESIRSYRRKWTKKYSTIIWDSQKRCAFELNLIYNSGLVILETTHPDSSRSGPFHVLSCRNLFIHMPCRGELCTSESPCSSHLSRCFTELCSTVKIELNRRYS